MALKGKKFELCRNPSSSLDSIDWELRKSSILEVRDVKHYGGEMVEDSTSVVCERQSATNRQFWRLYPRKQISFDFCNAREATFRILQYETNLVHDKISKNHHQCFLTATPEYTYPPNTQVTESVVATWPCTKKMSEQLVKRELPRGGVPWKLSREHSDMAANVLRRKWRSKCSGKKNKDAPTSSSPTGAYQRRGFTTIEP